MRLIDADAEIKKIEEEIQHTEKIIEQWRSRKIPRKNLYDIDKNIRKLERNITDCKIEIRILKNYTTAYDPDKVIEELKERSFLKPEKMENKKGFFRKMKDFFE